MKIKHVLLIDDNEINNYITKAIITKSNIAEKITEMTSAIDALEYLESLNNPSEFPDVIFLDLRMPEMDGFGFLDAYIKLSKTNKQSPVFILSSSTDQNDMQRALQYPVVKKYFSKPLHESMLENL
jgi:CheY-like chemotaxis protein